MCRNIRPLFNFQPPATDEEIINASVQFVRKISGTTRPSRINETAFNQAVHDISGVVRVLLDSMVTNAPPKDREIEARKARERTRKRYGQI